MHVRFHDKDGLEYFAPVALTSLKVRGATGYVSYHPGLVGVQVAGGELEAMRAALAAECPTVPSKLPNGEVNAELLAACKVAASAAGQDWLQMQLMLADVIARVEKQGA